MCPRACPTSIGQLKTTTFSMCSFQGTGLKKTRNLESFLVPERPEHTRSHPEHEGKDGQQRQYLVGDRLEK
jgi:hypothetical protein